MLELNHKGQEISNQDMPNKHLNMDMKLPSLKEKSVHKSRWMRILQKLPANDWPENEQLELARYWVLKQLSHIEVS
jgi:hypothetical protein